MVNLVPRSFFSPRFPSFWDDEDSMLSPLSITQDSGLTVSEDDKNIYVEAAVPGLDPDKVEVTYDKGVLWIRGNQEQEEKDDKKKYYRKASSSFSYHVAVPGKIDEQAEPNAVCKNGVMRVTFAKVPEVQPKKITVKKE